MHSATPRPFTVVCCEPCGGAADVAVSAGLAQSVRRCEHGVLVISACVLGELACGAGRHGIGAMVVLQPCSIDRRPAGPARWVGPITDSVDVAVLRDWVEQGEWDRRDLPDRLRIDLVTDSNRLN